MASAKVCESHEIVAITLAASQHNTPLGKLIKETNSPSGATSQRLLASLREKKSKGKKDFKI